jgi:hypothetical protein
MAGCKPEPGAARVGAALNFFTQMEPHKKDAAPQTLLANTFHIIMILIYVRKAQNHVFVLCSIAQNHDHAIRCIAQNLLSAVFVLIWPY